jgi:uncharacterized membrane protein
MADERRVNARDTYRGLVYLTLVPLGLGTYLGVRIFVSGAFGVVLAVLLTFLVVALLLRKAHRAR